MTVEEIRERCTAPGWSTRRVARVLGRDEGTVRAWMRGEPPGNSAAEWLARVEWRDRADGRVALIVRPE